MSIELTEARILARQMNDVLCGKRVKSYALKECEKLQRIGFLNKDTKSFDQLIGAEIKSVTSRGTVIRVKFSHEMNLLLAPEYGGRISYHNDLTTVPQKLHLRVDFSDNTVLVVRLMGMGLILALKDNELPRSYVYKRDFLSGGTSPIDDKEFTFERFSERLADRKDMMKSLLVGKNAIVIGLGNSAYQDIIFRAGIHPRRKASGLGNDEKKALYAAMKLVFSERIRLGGKDQFFDLHGNQGRYSSPMGSHIKICTKCGTRVEKLSIGGGQTYFCPMCQELEKRE